MEPQKLAHVKQLIRRHMNGTTAAIMKDLVGTPYSHNYGVALQHIRLMADEIRPELTPEDIDELWQSRWREMMLMAIELPDPALFSAEKAIEWATSLPTPEVMEYLSFRLLGNMPNAEALSIDIYDSCGLFVFACSFRTLGRAIAKRVAEEGREAATEKARQPLRRLLGVARGRLSGPFSDFDVTEAPAVGFLLRQSLRVGMEMELVDEVCGLLQASQYPQNRAVAAEVAAEREYLGL